MITKFLNLKKHLESKVLPVIVIYGDDSYLRERAFEQIKACLNIKFQELNCVPVNSNLMSDIIDASVVLPFMSETRLVAVKNFLPNEKQEVKEREKLLQYVENPLLTTCLIFSVATLSGLLSDLDVDYIDCSKLDIHSIERWIVVACKRFGKSISVYNAAKLSEYCLNDMTRINIEVQKICLYSEKEITLDDIDLMIEKDSEIALYEFANEIAKKNADKAFAMAESLLSKGETISGLVSSIYRTFRRMFFSLIPGLGQKDMASLLGVQPFAVVKSREAAEKFSQLKLKKAVELCAEADENLKKNINSKAVINLLVLSLLNL